MNTRRDFIKLAGLGLFTILPGAGRVWAVQRPEVRPVLWRRIILASPSDQVETFGIAICDRGANARTYELWSREKLGDWVKREYWDDGKDREDGRVVGPEIRVRGSAGKNLGEVAGCDGPINVLRHFFEEDSNTTIGKGAGA